MLTIELAPDVERRLQVLAQRNGSSVSAYAASALIEYLEDIEDVELARQRLAEPAATYTAAEVKHELGL